MFFAAAAASCWHVLGTNGQQLIDLAPTLESAAMPEPPKLPPTAATKNGKPPTRVFFNNKIEEHRKLIRAGTRDDHPAFAIAKKAAEKRSGKGGSDAR